MFSLDGALASGSVVALPLAFVAGLVMGLNPCCLALYPAAAATCCSTACDAPPRRTLTHAIAFVLGTATATTALGIVAALAGHTLEGLGGWIRYVVAFVPIVMGLHMLGWIRLPMPRAMAARQRERSIVRAYVSGLLLSLVIGPCGTPALAAILSYAALRGSLVFAALLLFFYGIGNGLPLVVAGAASGRASAWLARLGWGTWVERATGVAMVAVGFAFIWFAR